MEQDFKANDIGVIWFVRDRCDGWPSRAKIAYVMLYSRMGADRWIWPSKARLAADMSMKKDAAIAAVKDLQRMKLLQDRQPTHNPETGAQGTTRYRLRPPWEADYTSCTAYAPKSTTVALQPTGGVVLTDRGESDKPTGGVGSTDRGLSDQPTGASRINRHEGNQEKLTIEANQQEAETRSAAAPLPSDLISTLQRQVSSRLVMMKIADLHRQYGEKRLRFAGARVEEERRERRESDRDALSNPVARFIGIVKQSSDEEADAYFDELAKAKAEAAAEHEDPRDRLRRERARALGGGDDGPPDEDDAEKERLRILERQLLGPRRPKSTDEIDSDGLAGSPAIAASTSPAPPKELAPEEKAELNERKAEEARLADINRQRQVVVSRKMAEVVVETQDLPAGAHAVAVYERLLEFIDGPEYQQIGDGEDPIRAEYSRRLEEVRAREQRAV